MFTNRERANSFGTAAQRYDDHRPCYPDALIDDLLAPGVDTCLDVGAGTGIVSKQLSARGVDVLAVEPDERMAAVARGKAIPVEIATFERWDPAGRRFDLVTFGASFHWVDPAVALPKLAGLLNDRGRVALLWNRLRPTRPSHEELSEIYRDYLGVDAYGRKHDPDAVLNTLRDAGFEVSLGEYPQTFHLAREPWLELLFTYSSYLTLPVDAAAELRGRLAERIGDAGVTIEGNALAVIATPVGR